jgi:hypothetical protein
MLIRLATPIELRGSTIRAIQLRQPSKAARQRILTARGIADPLTASIEMVAALTGLTAAQVEELEPADFQRLTEGAIGFLKRQRRA